MGRTPVIGTVLREFLPWREILVYIEAIVRVYNRYGRRDNIYKARIKILVKAEGQKFIDAVEADFEDILERDVDGSAHLLTRRRVRSRRGLLYAARRHRTGRSRAASRAAPAHRSPPPIRAGSSATCTSIASRATAR